MAHLPHIKKNGRWAKKFWPSRNILNLNNVFFPSIVFDPIKINIKHCATEFQLRKQQRPEDIGSQVVDIYPNWVKVSMFLAAYLYALPTNFLFDFHTSPLISPYISKMHTGKHFSIFASFCLIQNIFQEAGMLPLFLRSDSFYIEA